MPALVSVLLQAGPTRSSFLSRAKSFLGETGWGSVVLHALSQGPVDELAALLAFEIEALRPENAGTLYAWFRFLLQIIYDSGRECLHLLTPMLTLTMLICDSQSWCRMRLSCSGSPCARRRRPAQTAAGSDSCSWSQTSRASSPGCRRRKTMMRIAARASRTCLCEHINTAGFE